MPYDNDEVPVYDGRLIERLIESVEQADPSVTVTDTIEDETKAFRALQSIGCPDCHASYGHKIFCPLLNERTAQAREALNGNPSVLDTLVAHALGVTL